MQRDGDRDVVADVQVDAAGAVRDRGAAAVEPVDRDVERARSLARHGQRKRRLERDRCRGRRRREQARDAVARVRHQRAQLYDAGDLRIGGDLDDDDRVRLVARGRERRREQDDRDAAGASSHRHGQNTLWLPSAVPGGSGVRDSAQMATTLPTMTAPTVIRNQGRV